MRRAVVSDQEHPTRRVVRLLAHRLGNEAPERADAVLALAAAKQFGALHVPGSEIGQRAGTRVFVLDVDRTSRCRGQRAMRSPPGLDGGLLIDAEHVIPRPQSCTFPATLIEIEDAACFAGEVRVAREDPAAMTPGPQRVLPEPAPERGAADPGDDA